MGEILRPICRGHVHPATQREHWPPVFGNVAALRNAGQWTRAILMWERGDIEEQWSAIKYYKTEFQFCSTRSRTIVPQPLHSQPIPRSAAATRTLLLRMAMEELLRMAALHLLSPARAADRVRCRKKIWTNPLHRMRNSRTTKRPISQPLI